MLVGMHTRVCVKDSPLPAERAVVLLIVLHDNEAANAEDVAAAQLDRPPLELSAHGTRVVVNLGDAAENLRVDLCAYGFGEMLTELWVLDLTGEGTLDAESGTLVEFCAGVSFRVVYYGVGDKLFKILIMALWLISPKRSP
jgi:hypothetical protein